MRSCHNDPGNRGVQSHPEESLVVDCVYLLLRGKDMRVQMVVASSRVCNSCDIEGIVCRLKQVEAYIRYMIKESHEEYLCGTINTDDYGGPFGTPS